MELALAFKLHSAVRYLVLVAGLAAVAKLALSWRRGGRPDRGDRALATAFTALFDLQLVLGALTFALGVFAPRIAGHLALTLGAAALLHSLQVRNRRRSEPGVALPLLAITGAMVLVVLGMLAIGRGPLTATAF